MKQSTVILLVVAVFLGVYFFHVKECFDTGHPDTKTDRPCPPNSEKCPSGDCKLKGDLYGMCGYTP